MARFKFGGTVADYLIDPDARGLLRLASGTLTLWSAKVGGTQQTDLRLGGVPVTTIAVAADGQVPEFEGPDEVSVLWADAGDGRIKLASEGRPGLPGADGAPGAGSDITGAEINAARDAAVAAAATAAAAVEVPARLARRDAMLRAVSLGATSGGSLLYYRHADDVRLIRPLGNDYHSEYFFRRTTSAFVVAGTKSLVFTATGIGKLMLATEPYLGGTATAVTYSGGWASTGSNSGNTKMAAWEGFPLTRDSVTLTYSGAGTSMTVAGKIAFNAPAADVQTALRTLPNVGATGVTVTGSVGGPYTVTFVGPLAAQNVAQMTADAAGLTGGAAPTVTVATTVGGGPLVDEVQTVTVSGTPTGGTFTLTFAGSTTFTALNPTAAYWINKWITIPGVGAAGVDAFVKITNVTGSGATVAFTATGGVAAAAAFTSVVSSIDPFKRTSTTAGDYVEWVSPTATRLGAILTVAATCGMVEVTINGGSVVANLLPTATQLVADGRMASSALTTNGGPVAPTARILDPYGPVTQWGVGFAIAGGLTAAAYTVRLTHLSTRNVAGSTSSILMAVAGFGYANGAVALNQAGAELFSTYRVGRFAANNELAIDTLFSGGTAAFVGGEGHGYESQTQAMTYTVNGATVAPANGQRLLGETIVMKRKASVFHPSDTVNASWLYEAAYLVDAAPGTTISIKATAARDLSIASAGYITNWDVYPTKTQGSNTDTAYTTIGVADGTYINGDKHDALAWWDETLGSGAVAVLVVPDAKRQTGNWTSAQKVVTRKLQGSPVGGASVGYPHSKGYVQIPAQSLVVGAVLTAEARYIVGRDPALAPMLPALPAL